MRCGTRFKGGQDQDQDQDQDDACPLERMTSYPIAVLGRRGCLGRVSVVSTYLLSSFHTGEWVPK